MRDYSNNFEQLRKQLSSELGDRRYIDIRRNLRPRYSLVWCDLVFSHVLLWSSVWFSYMFSRWFFVPLWALLIGLFLHRLSLFLHEGAHFLLAPTKRLNDWLCDVLVSPLVLTSVASYRPGHMLHHRHLGETNDPERSYHSALNRRFVFSGLLGANVLRVVSARPQAQSDTQEVRRVVIPLAGVFIYLSLVVLGLMRFNLLSIASIILGVISVFPAVGSIRQLLEHRAESSHFVSPADGPISRMFPFLPFGWLVGAAGFDRHLLHHWDPGISYTQLANLERQLAQTSAGAIIAARRTTYRSCFCDLWSWS